MATPMKTTIEISDALLTAAKERASKSGTTLRAVVEDGLRTILAESGEGDSFVLRDASVNGKGLHPDVREGGWKRIAELTYEGHGG
jgi:Arc/MetJ family transcription regulator